MTSDLHRRRHAVFGTLRDGREVEAVRLGIAGGLQVEVLTYGGRVRSIIVPAALGAVDVVLGLGSVGAYEADGSYLGAIIGRCCNRIADARFSLGGTAYALTANEGRHHLHGGRHGLHHRLWRLVDAQPAPRPLAVLEYRSPEGEEGYPGTLAIRATFEVDIDTLCVRLEAETDRTTPVALTSHHYFNLDGKLGATILGHSLAIAGDVFLPVDRDLLPTGERLAVDGTPFDLRSPARIGDRLTRAHPQLAIENGFDHAYILAADQPAADLRAASSGVRMQLTTDQPALHFYSGNRMGGSGNLGPRHAALCLEPENFPNAINRPDFPSPLLVAGETYRTVTCYRFSG